MCHLTFFRGAAYIFVHIEALQSLCTDSLYRTGPELLFSIAMLSHCAKRCTIGYSSTIRSSPTQRACPLLSSSGRTALPFSTKPFRSHIRSRRASRQAHVPRAALDLSSIPQEALLAGSAGKFVEVTLYEFVREEYSSAYTKKTDAQSHLRDLWS